MQIKARKEKLKKEREAQEHSEKHEA